MPRILLAVFAHPDDETFLAGPLLAKCAAEGAHVELVTATPAMPPASYEIGSDRTASLAPRLASLLCAAAALGIARVHSLGYAESPMFRGGRRGVSQYARHMNRPTDRLLTSSNLPGITSDILRIIEDLRPDVVLADSPYGAYGHPDHIMVHQATVTAFERWSAVVGVASASGAGNRPRLYALAYPMLLVRLTLLLMKLRGIPITRLGPEGDINLTDAVRAARAPALSIPVARFVRWRRTAARCYTKEIAAAPLPLRLLERLPLWFQRAIFLRQGLSRVSPRDGAEPAVLFPNAGPVED